MADFLTLTLPKTPQTILITGAADGLGRAMAILLAQNQNQLLLLDKNLPALNALYDELATKDCEPAIIPFDLQGANPDDYQQLRETLQQQYGKLDVLFLNAATLPGFTPLEAFDVTQWYQVLQVNLNANFHLIQNCLTLLKYSSDGKLVSIIDQEIEKHPAYYGAYGVAKAGLEQLMKTVAKEQSQCGITFYNAKLEAFASNTRSRQFPSENPNNLPSTTQTATQLLDIVFNHLQSEFILKQS